MLKAQSVLQRGSLRRLIKDWRRTSATIKNGVDARTPTARVTAVPESNAVPASGAVRKAAAGQKKKFSALVWTLGAATVPIVGLAAQVWYVC